MDKRAGNKRRNKIKIRLTQDHLDGLCMICNDMLQIFKPENETELLIRAYLKELCSAINKKATLNQSMYTIHMSFTEAVAFRQLWNVLHIEHDKYAGILVRSVLNKIDNNKETEMCL
jgi:hypothetical protein